MLDTTAQSVNSLLRRTRAAFESRLPAAERERARSPTPNASATPSAASPTRSKQPISMASSPY